MPAVQREIERFQEFLGNQGLKLTRERTALLREIFATHYHFEADELLFKMKEKALKISRATVYRTLELLVKSGMVRRVHLGEDHYHYEHVRGDSHHDHLICTTCGTVIEFSDPELERRPTLPIACSRSASTPCGSVNNRCFPPSSSFSAKASRRSSPSPSSSRSS